MPFHIRLNTVIVCFLNVAYSASRMHASWDKIEKIFWKKKNPLVKEIVFPVMATEHKELKAAGNAHFHAKQYTEAIECYSHTLIKDSTIEGQTWNKTIVFICKTT